LFFFDRRIIKILQTICHSGSIKDETNFDTNEIPTQQKKSKTSHVYKSESNILSMNIKEEPMNTFTNDIPSATVAPMSVQPKKEKPTAK
jgi:hypothetical protein